MSGPQQQQQQQQPFPVAAVLHDDEMAESSAATQRTSSSGWGQGHGHRGRDPMVDLEEALQLAVAYFDGDPDAVKWATMVSSDDDEQGGAAATGWQEPSAGSHDDEPGLGEDPASAVDSGWPGERQWEDVRQDDALLHMTPSGEAGAPRDELEEAELEMTDKGAEPEIDGGSNLPEPSPEERPPPPIDIGAGDDDDSGEGESQGGKAEEDPAVAAAAQEAQEMLGGLQLDDIDAEPKDAMAPAAGPLSIEAALAQQGKEGAEVPPPPIVPAPTDVAAAEEDPVAALEAAIQADKPKFEPSAEWMRMMEAVKGELEEAVQNGQPELVQGSSYRETDDNSSTGAKVSDSGEAVTSVRRTGSETQTPSSQQQQQQGQRGEKDMEMTGESKLATAEGGAGVAGGAQQQGTAAAMADGDHPILPPSQPPPPPATTASDEERKRTFAMLQPICSMLLLQRAEPQRITEALRGLEVMLQEASQSGLQQCWDYVLFPLLMMLDAVAATRQKGAGGDEQQVQQQLQKQHPAATATDAMGGSAGALMALPAMSADRAAEAALACTLCVLRRCSCQSGEGTLGLLRRLAAILELPTEAASEEIRLQTLQCLSALAQGVAQRRPAPGVRQALVEESSAPLVGYLSSLALKIAENEAQRGSSGSRAIRDTALQALLHLLTAVAGPAVQQHYWQDQQQHQQPLQQQQPSTEEAKQAAEALAFFLPGIAVGLCRALLVAASNGGGACGKDLAPAGPSASSAAVIAAVRGLVVLLVACLGDVAVEPALHGPAGAASVHSMHSTSGRGSVAHGGSGGGWQDVEMEEAGAAADSPGGGDALRQALDQLRELSQRAKGGSASSTSTAAPTDKEGSAAAAASQPSQQSRQQGRMRVERSAEWVQESASKLHEMLATALPPLMAHQRATVREALVRGCCQLLDSCGMALQPQTQETLLQLLLSAAQDRWQDVAGSAQAWLQQHAVGAGLGAGAAPHGAPAPSAAASLAAGPALAAAHQSLLLQLIDGLAPALRSGDLPGRQHAQRLTSALQVCSPAWFAASVVHHPLRLQQLVSAFLDAFAFDASVAGMLLYAAAAPSGSATSYAPGSQATAAAAGGSMVGAGGMDATSGVAAQAGAPPDGQGQGQVGDQQLAAAGVQGSVVLLPRMPLGLTIITTNATYEAVAAALRAAAALAAAADAAPGSGGTTLRGLVDACLARLRQALAAAQTGISGEQHGGRADKRSRQGLAGSGSTASASSGTDQIGQDQPGGDPGGLGQAPWQLHAASVAAVLAELLLGASPAWQPSWRLAGASSASGASATAELEALAATAVQELVQEAVWALPTSTEAEEGLAAAGGTGARYSAHTPLLLDNNSGAATFSSGQQRPTVQQLGCNALLLKAALECFGAAARALGPRFAQNGRLLRAALLPMLEKLADSTQVVSSAASAAVGSVCWWCGYAGSLQRLVAANADYVVDGCCAQLRQLDAHPRAPQLFKALLQQAGVAPQLLPLLAEPARNSVQGLGILARCQQPQHVLAFLQVMLPVAAAAGSVAQQARAEMRQAAEQVQQRWEEQQQRRQEAEAAAAAAYGGVEAATEAEIRRFFERRRQQREARQQEGEGEGHPLDAEEAEEEATKVALSGPEREHISLLRRHLHAAGSLAQAVADAASPLALSQSLQVSVQSFGVCMQALRALAAVTEAVELDTDKIQLMIRTRGQVAAPDPQTPRLLPSVHLAWVPLVGALQDWRVSVVEGALQFLADCACLAGSFLRKRFSQEALPVLQRLLREGPARRNIIAPGQDDTTSPATVQRAQLAVLRCLRQVSTCDSQLSIAGVSGAASDALLPCAQALLAAVGDAMGPRQAAPVREQATQAYVALARVDPDAAWCQLSAALPPPPDPAAAPAAAAPAALAIGVEAGVAPQVPPKLLLKSSGQPLSFPDKRQIAPQLPATQAPPPRAAAAAGKGSAPSGGSGTVVPPGLRDCGGPKLEAMLRQVERLQPKWHRQVDDLLARHLP